METRSHLRYSTRVFEFGQTNSLLRTTSMNIKVNLTTLNYCCLHNRSQLQKKCIWKSTNCHYPLSKNEVNQQVKTSNNTQAYQKHQFPRIKQLVECCSLPPYNKPAAGAQSLKILQRISLSKLCIKPHDDRG